MTHIHGSKLTVIGWDNRLSPGLCQTIISTNAGTSLISVNRYGKSGDIITHPCPNISGDFTKPPLRLGHGWIITFHWFRGMYLLIHCLLSMMVWLISVNRICPCPWTLLLFAVHLLDFNLRGLYLLVHKIHYNDVTMTTTASQITSLTVVYSIVYSGADQRKHQSSASLAFVRGIHRDRWIPRTKGR